MARRTALEAMSPLKVLSRGYAMTRDSAGRVVTDAAALKPGEIITVTLRNGEVDAAVREIRGGSNP